jgi:hypothetical protein
VALERPGSGFQFFEKTETSVSIPNPIPKMRPGFHFSFYLLEKSEPVVLTLHQTEDQVNTS